MSSNGGADDDVSLNLTGEISIGDRGFWQNEMESVDREAAKENRELNVDENSKGKYFDDELYQNLLRECGVIEDSDDELTMSNTKEASVRSDGDSAPEITEPSSKEPDSDTSCSSFRLLAKRMDSLGPHIYKRIISHGISEKVPEKALVIYNYKFYLEDLDEPFDSSSLQGRPDRQRVGTGSLLEGVDIALMSMRKQEHSLFVFYPEVMFGDIGAQPRIPKKAMIFADIEVIDFIERRNISDFFDKNSEERKDLPFEEHLKVGKECRLNGNALCRNRRPANAIRKYRVGIDVLIHAPVNSNIEDEQRKQELFMLNKNMAQAFIELRRPKPALKCCNDALRKEPNDIKCLYRKAMALKFLNEFDEARKEVCQLLRLRPDQTNAIQLLKDIDEKRRDALAFERDRCRRMFPSHLRNCGNQVDDADRSTSQPDELSSSTMSAKQSIYYKHFKAFEASSNSTIRLPRHVIGSEDELEELVKLAEQMKIKATYDDNSFELSK